MGGLVWERDSDGVGTWKKEAGDPWFVFDSPSPDAVASGVATDLKWSVNPAYPSKQGGPNPFDLTTPTRPVVIADGMYAIGANAQFFTTPAAPCLGRFQLFIDPDGDGINAGSTMYLTDQDWQRTLPLVRFLPAGTVLSLTAAQTSGGSLEAFHTTLVSYRLT